MGRANAGNTKQLMVKMSDQLYTEVFDLAVKDDRSMASLIRLALREYLQRRKET